MWFLRNLTQVNRFTILASSLFWVREWTFGPDPRRSEGRERAAPRLPFRWAAVQRQTRFPPRRVSRQLSQPLTDSVVRKWNVIMNNSQDEQRALKWSPDRQPLHRSGTVGYVVSFNPHTVLPGIMVIISILQRKSL